MVHAAPEKRNVWVLPGPRQSTPSTVRLRLFCFPMAGSGACMYHEWSFPDHAGIEVVPVELPGTNSRMKEPKPTSLRHLAADAVAGLAPLMGHDQPPFALWGHSMGAWLAFEVVRRLERQPELQRPRHLFVSANRSPTRADLRHNPDGLVMHQLPEDVFWDAYARRYGDNEMLRHPALRARLLPGFRADFRLVETYTPSSVAPIECGLTVYGGRQDPRYSAEQLEAWGELAPVGSGHPPFVPCWMPGGHMFVRESQAALLADLTPRLVAVAGAEALVQ